MSGPGHRLRTLLAQPGALVAPGAFSGLSAKMVEQAGFSAVYASGAGVANNLLGQPDVGLLTMTEMLEQIRHMTAATSLPLVADVDTGYGNPINVHRTVQEFEAAGVAGIQIEDQVMPKRCGHFEGKEVVSTSEMVAKLQAALEARRDADLLVIARTDARAKLGLEEALDRAVRYLEAGADMVFVEAPTSVEELQEITKLPGWTMANMVEDGKTPLLTAEELSEIGFKFVIFPNTASRAAMRSMEDVLCLLKREGGSGGFRDRLVSMADRNRITGLDAIGDLESRYLNNSIDES